MRACLIFFFVAAAIGLLFWALLKMVRYLKRQHDENESRFFDELPASSDVVAQYDFGPREWEMVQRKEFVEDERGTKWIGPYTGIRRSRNAHRPRQTGRICFLPDRIFLSDGADHKTYHLGGPRDAATLREISLLRATTPAILRVVVTVQQEEGVTEEIYHVPLPTEAAEKGQDLIDFYQRVRDQRGRLSAH